MTEPGYSLLMYLFHVFHISFQGFLCIAYAFTIGTVSWFIKSHTPNFALCLGLYAVFPYCIDAVQLRNTIAFSICLIGIHYLIRERGRRKYWIFIFSVLMASTFHFSAILFLMLLVPYFLDGKECVFFTAVGMLILGGFTNKGILESIIGIFVGDEKAIQVIERIQNSGYTNRNIYIMLFVIVASAFIIFACLMIALENQKLEIRNGVNVEYEAGYNKVLSFFIKAIVVSLLMLPLVFWSLDIYRIQRYLLILGCVGMTIYDVIPSRVRFMQKKAYYVLLFLAALALFYLQIIKLNNCAGTFQSLLEYNRFL